VFLLAQFADGSGFRFEMLRSATFDEQDRACGTDTYRLVIDSGPTHYGGVISWLIDEADVLRITLDANAADVLETPQSRSPYSRQIEPLLATQCRCSRSEYAYLP
jgi:hypothetical protein